jgi:hypothetical protein
LSARRLEFPRDHGSHPELRTEWWYMTGHAQAAGRLWGFQVTFFRSRVDGTQGLRSAFAAKQLLFAHAAHHRCGQRPTPAPRPAHCTRLALAWRRPARRIHALSACSAGRWTRSNTPGQGSRYTAHG